MSIRRTVITLGAAAGLAMSGLVMSAAVPAFAGSTTVNGIVAGPYTIQTAVYTGEAESLDDTGCANPSGYLCQVDLAGGLDFDKVQVDGGTKYYEYEAIIGNGLCLEIAGSAPSYYVRLDTCEGRASELWWAPEESDGNVQLINEYATSELHHDGCLWAPSGYQDVEPEVQDCVSSQPDNQQWHLNFV
jgi:hypothetical protein